MGAKYSSVKTERNVDQDDSINIITINNQTTTITFIGAGDTTSSTIASMMLGRQGKA
jgi:hypothetical protein